MSGVRVLVGTRKGAFILTSDGKREKWDVSGPHFAGWEIYHLKGSPVDPESASTPRRPAAGSGRSSSARRRRQDLGSRSDNKFVYDGVAAARTSGTTARRIRGSSSASGISSRR